jgi:hypothetical protein
MGVDLIEDVVLEHRRVGVRWDPGSWQGVTQDERFATSELLWTPQDQLELERRDRVHRGLERAEDGAILALTAEEARREPGGDDDPHRHAWKATN